MGLQGRWLKPTSPPDRNPSTGGDQGGLAMRVDEMWGKKKGECGRGGIFVPPGFRIGAGACSTAKWPEIGFGRIEGGGSDQGRGRVLG